MTGSATTFRSLAMRNVRVAGLLCAGCLILVAGGCSRTHYRTRADEDAYHIIGEQTGASPWEPPFGYDVIPDPRSRLFDPTWIDDPLLPEPAPQLYSYELPFLPDFGPPEETIDAPPSPTPDGSSPLDGPVFGDLLNSTGDAPASDSSPIEAAYWQTDERSADSVSWADDRQVDEDIDVAPIVIPDSSWQAVPVVCQRRMFEFPRIVEEYRQTYSTDPSQSARDSSPRLTLEEIVDLAVLNSREYQTQKEILYRAALRLTLPRYDYELKFSAFPGANRGVADYTHTRTDGETVNRLALPINVDADKMLATAGDFIARFANDVVLTFNGPDGFTADVSNELFLELSQTVFQRDVRFEALTQAERDVVYAARDLARFRKVLFNQLVRDYYGILQTYRQVEIDTLNYFTLVRAFSQGNEEYRIGQTPRVQVDQIEQNALFGLTRLIGTCTRLERQLDSLKIRIGLPTETPVNVDLTELEELTLTDEAAVTSDLVRRVSDQLHAERNREEPDFAQILSVAVELLTRLQDSVAVRSDPGGGLVDLESLRDLQNQLHVDQARLQKSFSDARVAEVLDDPTSPAIRRLRFLFEALENDFQLLERLYELAERTDDDPRSTDVLRTTIDALQTRRAMLEDDVNSRVEQLQVERLTDLVAPARQLRSDLAELIAQVDEALGQETDAGVALENTLQRLDDLLLNSASLLDESTAGLVPVEISVDDAMMTALVLRMDLMNERGFLADDWRQIKLAADDLKSILNLSASQSLEDFDFDDSQTRLRAVFDAPLNRRAQRNAFREELIDYQVARRRLMALEDSIKFDVRDDLRDLFLAKEQYVLGVASAALAFERVVGTRIQLRLGVSGVRARDFLEAQTAYVAALSAVADRHISYVTSRTQLFLDLELLQLDDEGFWPPQFDETYQPSPFYAFPSTPYPPYGLLPGRLHYSDDILRMLSTPVGTPWVHETLLRSVDGPSWDAEPTLPTDPPSTALPAADENEPARSEEATDGRD